MRTRTVAGHSKRLASGNQRIVAICSNRRNSLFLPSSKKLSKPMLQILGVRGHAEIVNRSVGPGSLADALNPKHWV